MATVSVIIPFHNRLEWLRDAVRSVLSQSFADFELILVDDGSTEPAEFLKEIGDPRIRLLRQENRGPSAARNLGLGHANGKYVAFLDSDDVFLPDKLVIQVGRMDAMPGIPLSHTSYRRMDAEGNDLEDVPSGTFGGRVYPAIVSGCPIATPTVMVRRETLARERLAFEESARIGEDVILWIRIARRHEILGIDEALTKVRIHGRNAFSDPIAQYRGSMEILRHVFREDAGFGFLFRRRAFARVCSSVAHAYLAEENKKEAMRCFARSATYWPLDPGVISILLRLVIPERFKPGLRRLRDSLKGRRRLLPGNRREDR